MSFTGYIKTEKNLGAKWNGWLWLTTTINASIDIIQHQCNGSCHYRRDIASDTGENIYCHSEAAPEPITDGEIRTSIFDSAEIEYSGGAGIIKSFTSATSFFDTDQDLGEAGEDWTIYYNAKVFDVPPGNTGWMAWSFYKRDTDDNDTLLWFKTVFSIALAYTISGRSTTTTPIGTVTTADRLRIVVSTGYQAT